MMVRLFGTGARSVALLALAVLLVACSIEGDGGGDGSSLFVGRVFDGQTGEPVRDALVRTVPPTEDVTTGASGEYTLRGAGDAGGDYAVFVEHFAYGVAETRAVVTGGDTRRIDFPLVRKASGLIASVQELQVGTLSSSEVFRLASTVPDLDWSAISSEPWLSVSPARGQLSSGQTTFVTVSVERDALTEGMGASGEIAFNASGLDGVVVGVRVEPGPRLTHSRQQDCRQLDVLRVGDAGHRAPLVLFPRSLRLPEQEGQRFLELPNAALFDSFVVTEPGRVTLTHVHGGSDRATLELFELGLSDEIRVLGRDDGFGLVPPRARVAQDLLAGVYCYTLHDEDDAFENPTFLRLSLDFEPLALEPRL